MFHVIHNVERSDGVSFFFFFLLLLLLTILIPTGISIGENGLETRDMLVNVHGGENGQKKVTQEIRKSEAGDTARW